MAINYFEDLGFGANLREGMSNLASGLMYKQQKQEQQAQQAKQEQQAALQFANEQQKLRAAQGAGAFYNALQANNPQAALQIAKTYEQEINSLGDPAFTIANVEQMLQTPEGMNQLKQMAAGTVQLAAGPGKFAQYVQAQQRPLESSQAPTSIKELEYYQKLQKTNPEAAAKFAKARGYVDTPKEQALTPQERNYAKYQQMLQAGDPGAEAFGRASGLVSKEGQVLSATTEKSLQDSINEAELNAANTVKYLDLASRFKSSDVSGGFLGTGGSWREALKTAVGSQDEVSKMVGDWTKIRSGEAIASLPQGPATDADIRLALKPLPENANAEYMDKYLRGLAKIAQYKASYNQAKADFISENGSLRGNGTNFGSYWSKRRSEVLDQINKDPRFKQESIDNFLGTGRNQQPAQQTQQQEEYRIIEVRE